MKRKLWYSLLGAVTGLILVFPYCHMPIEILPEETLWYLGNIFPFLPQRVGIQAILQEFLLYVLMGCVFCNDVMEDISIARLYVFPRSGSRCRWFAEKAGRLFLGYLCYWLPCALVAVGAFLVTNGLPWSADIFHQCGLYLLTNVLLAYFVFVLLINVITLLWSKWIALFATLVFYMAQFIAAVLAMQKGEVPKWLSLLPYFYTKFSLFHQGAAFEGLPLAGVLLLEFLLTGLLLLGGLFIAKRKLCRLGESL